MNRDRRVKRDPKTGTWSFVVDVPGPSGKRRQVRRRGFATSKQANDALHDLLDGARQGVVTSRRGFTVERFLLDRWLPSLPGRVRPTTLDSYTRIAHNHLVPRLGTIKLTALDAAAIETMLGELASAGLSSKTRRNVLGVLSKACADAARWKLVLGNAASGSEWPEPSQATARAWSGEQVASFFRHVANMRDEALWRYFVISGARRGEVVGLRWPDVDLDAGIAVVVNQRTLAGGRVVEGPPKTKSGARTITLDAETVAVLRRWRRIQREELLRLGVRPEVEYVFTGPGGLPLWPQRVTSEFRDLCDELGLPRIGPHGLRHSAATWMIAAGISPKLVSQRLGHSHVSITLGLYSHVLPGHDRAAVDAFAAALAAQSESECDHGVTTAAVDQAGGQQSRGFEVVRRQGLEPRTR